MSIAIALKLMDMASCERNLTHIYSVSVQDKLGEFLSQLLLLLLCTLPLVSQVHQILLRLHKLLFQ